VIKELKWNRQDDRKFPLSDFINEQSKVRVWFRPESFTYYDQNCNDYEIKTIDVFSDIFKVYNSCTPSIRSVMDCRHSPS
jgi:hypothetical protein